MSESGSLWNQGYMAARLGQPKDCSNDSQENREQYDKGYDRGLEDRIWREKQGLEK